MLTKSKAFQGFAAPDLDAAKRFYGETLGLEVTEVMDGLIGLNIEGGNNVMIYVKPDHEPANYTILNFPVANIDEAVDELTKRGVTFERYDGFEQDEKGIARPEGGQEGPPIAWFTDPAGNILAVLQQ
jgi:catechol 2,3-dioxygenase-like lactoylglutathione lyase family enzyme